MSAEITIKSKMAEFKDALQAGVNGLVQAGEIYVEALDEDPRNADKFRDEFTDWVPASAWSNFEAIGRKWIHPRLVMGGMSDRKKTSLIKKLPYSTQERVFERERFQLLTADGDTLQIDLMEATIEQAEQLCDGSSIRNLSAQKAWTEARAAAVSQESAEVLPYTIIGGKVTFRRSTVLTRSELKRLLAEM